MRRAAGALAALLITSATLAYALWDLNFALLWELIRGGHNWLLIPFSAILIVFYLLNAQRWSLMLRPFGRFAARDVAPSMLIGLAGNNVLPLRLGELIRTVIFAREFAQPKSGVLMTLVLERALDILGILVVYVAGLAIIGPVPPAFRWSALLAALSFVTLAALLFLFLRYPHRLRHMWQLIGRSLPAGATEGGLASLGHLEKGLGSLKSPALASVLVLISLARWLLAASLVWLCIRSYGPPVPIGLAMMVIGITAFAVSFPSVPGFVGPIQAAFVLALTPFSVPQEVAVAASLMFLLGHWVPVTAIGGLLFVSRRYSYTGIRGECETLERSKPL